MKKIKMTFAPDGTTTIEASGFTGTACLAATKDLEEAIGKVGSRKPTREMGTASSLATIEQK